MLGRLGAFGLNVMKTKADRLWDEALAQAVAQAVREGCNLRFRPLLMTALTTGATGSRAAPPRPEVSTDAHACADRVRSERRSWTPPMAGSPAGTTVVR